MNPKIALTKDFELIESIGRGVSSEVYKGLRVDPVTDFSQVVAVKIFKSPKFRKKFKNELINLSKLNHPNIISVKDWGEFEQKFYLVTEYVHGVDLNEVIKSLDSKSIKLKKYILNQIYEGLSELKNKGIAHGDLKPSNIMLSISGEVKLVDISFDDLGQVFATPEFSAPEILSGIQSSFKSDLYSLGIICNKMSLNQRKLLSLEPGDRDFEIFKGINVVEEKLRLSELIRKRIELKNIGDEVYEFTEELKAPTASYAKSSPFFKNSFLNLKTYKKNVLSFLPHFVLFLLLSIGIEQRLPQVKTLKLRSLKAYEYWNSNEWVSLPTDQIFFLKESDRIDKLKFRIADNEFLVQLPADTDFTKNIIIDAL
jgi:serine/threonine protein kinase